MDSTENRKYVWDYFIEYFTEYGVAGLMGNLYAESTVEPNVVERLCLKRYAEQGINYTDDTYTSAINSGMISKSEFLSPLGKHYGYGLAQWTTSARKEGLYDLAKRKNASIADISIQCEYLLSELQNSFKSVYNTLKTASDIATASDIVLMKFECPANANTQIAKRQKYSNEFYQLYAKGGNMTEKDIVLCGHGSNTPSYKNMYTYLENRYQQIASNGKRKGVVSVKRLKALTDSQREVFQKYYASIIGRNIYSQNLREYCYTMYGGKFYSDCSSSGIKTYEKCGHVFPWTLNTAGIYQSDLFENVPVTIQAGHITNPEVLKVGDALLFVGNDASRPLQIGHVEYVYSMPTTSTKSVAKEYPKWIKSGSDWYYRLSEGVNAHGWQKIAETGNANNKHWYYFDAKGKMATGWFEVDGKTYYASTGGSLEGALYRTDEQGAQSIWYV